MKQFLVYGDSLSWGFIPNTRKRLAFENRWTGVLEKELASSGNAIRVLENCLNGRRTAWNDPFKAGRNGAQGLAQVIEMHSPLARVILMLGINDFQSVHHNTAWLSANGTARLIDIIRQAPIESDMPNPRILIVAPPTITEVRGDLVDQFKGAEERSLGLSEELRGVAEKYDTDYFDAGALTKLSEIDGIHLDAAQHKVLGKAIAEFILTHEIG